nr:hypothetical protein [Pelagimonas phthalicica]
MDMETAVNRVADVGQGLAFEADLFADPAQRIALWQCNSPALVTPKSYRKRAGFEEAVARSGARGWPVALRPSGGGTVPQGPGVLNLVMALTVPQGFGIHQGYQLLCDPIIALGQSLGLDLRPGATPDSFCDGEWNLSSQGRKMVGTAQRLRPLKERRVRIMAHALILMDGPVEPGAEAVDAFHRDLGLDPVRSEVHTTLQAECKTRLPDEAEIARLLTAHAEQAVRDRLGE